jgi:3-hydroxyisobutyrate dehydrogenase
MTGKGAAVLPGEPIGFAGLGRMGRPMASRLAEAGYRVAGFDISVAARDSWSDSTGCASVDSAAGLAAGARAVVLMLPDSAAVSHVLIGQGLLGLLQAGAIVVDMSSSAPEKTRELAAEAARRGLSYVDAPVSGGVSGAQDGTLTIMVGGDPGPVDRVRELLAVMGSTVMHVGGAGAGHAVKALNNLMSATHLLISSEAMVAAARFGLDVPTALAAVNGSSGRSGSTLSKWPKFIVPGSFDSGFSLALMVKDIRTAVELIMSAGGRAELAEANLEMWERAADALGPDADHTEIARWVDSGP